MQIRIAIVDDNYQLLDSLKERLRVFEHLSLVFTATNGRECLTQLEKLPLPNLPQVILMDIEMDKMNGIEATRQIKSRFPSIEILMLSAFDDDEKIFEAIKAGASGYLLKDESKEKIYEAIEIVMQGGSLLSPSIARKTLKFFTLLPSQNKQNASSDNPLTNREMEILKMVIEGITYPEIAEKLYISYGTVRTHVKNIFEKLQVHNKQEATQIAIRKKWFPPF
ncbi:MAG: response regulator transcription factor [Raineya sp.]|nr:response regulator transcription factor [Raineya sp.]MDW8295945.1 response regulator transcription factor [Raineya sp.]